MNIFFKIIIFSFPLFFPLIARASFGISPASLFFDHSLPGSIHNQSINFSRENTSEDSEYKISINGDNSKNWIILPDHINVNKGEHSQIINLQIQIPKDVQLQKYNATIQFEKTIRASSSAIQTIEAIQLPIQIEVTNKQFWDLKVQNLDIHKASAAKYFWGFILPGKLTISTNIINNGNIASGPNTIVMNIYQKGSSEILETITQKINDTVPAFGSKIINIELPHKQKDGQYYVDTQFYFENRALSKFSNKTNIEISNYSVENKMLIRDFIHYNIFYLLIILFSIGSLISFVLHHTIKKTAK